MNRLRMAILAAASLLLGGCALFRPAEPTKLQMFTVAAKEGDFLAGAAVVDITPESNFDMGGYAIGRDATGVHDPLYARALVLKRGEHEQILVAVDLVGLFRPFIKEVVAEVPNINPERVIIASTHNHSSPDSMGIWGTPPIRSGLNDAFMQKVKRGILQSIADARAALRPAEVGWTTVPIDPTEFIKNVNRKGLVDPEIAVLHLRDQGGGATIAVLTELGCHPEVVPEKNTLVSADYPGYTVHALEDEFGGVGIYVSGDLGALVSPVRHMGDHHAGVYWEAAKRIGDRLAEYTAFGVHSIEHYEKSPRLAVYHTPIYLKT
ncbi:MAG: neutral/alkaline non-lysosomal ceramidase N-terminal domain-containing protein, partial [Bacteroidota bacterium]